MRKINAIEVLDGRRLRLEYGQESVEIDLAPLSDRGGVFAQLGDRGFFEQVSLGPGGRSVVWPGELDFCADALWLEAHSRVTP